MIGRLFSLLALAAVLCGSSARAEYNGDVQCSQMPALTSAVTSSVGSCATSVASGATLTDTINQEFHASTSELDQTNTTTLAVVTGLSQTLTAGKTYTCHGYLPITASATAGAKVGLVATASLSATSISRTIKLYTGTTLSANSTATALDATSGGAGATAAVTDATIEASIVVNAGGTINVEGAQNVATSGASNTAKFLINGNFYCVRVN